MSGLKILSAKEARKVTKGLASPQDILTAIGSRIVELSQCGSTSCIIQTHGFQDLPFRRTKSGFGNDGVEWQELSNDHKEVVQCLIDEGYAVTLCVTNSITSNTGLHISWRTENGNQTRRP